MADPRVYIMEGQMKQGHILNFPSLQISMTCLVSQIFHNPIPISLYVNDLFTGEV